MERQTATPPPTGAPSLERSGHADAARGLNAAPLRRRHGSRRPALLLLPLLLLLLPRPAAAQQLPELGMGNDFFVTEGNTANFTVDLNPAAPGPGNVTVDWETVDGTATAGEDYTAASGTVTFSPGDSLKTISVRTLNDNGDEPNEDFNVRLVNGSASGAMLPPAAQGREQTATIRDNDPRPRVTLSLSPPSISEQGGTSRVTAELDRFSASETTVTISVTPQGQADAGDYTLSSNRVLTIPAGETQSTGTVTIDAVDNDDLEGNKTLTVSGSAANAVGIAGPGDVALTVRDNEQSLQLSIADARFQEDDPSRRTRVDGIYWTSFDFTVTMPTEAAEPVTVDWATTDGTAEITVDYRQGGGTLTFAPGEFEKTISVLVRVDDLEEPLESFGVRLTNPSSNAEIVDGSATGLIENDDLPSVTVAPSVNAVEEGEDAVFLLARAGVTSYALDVAFEVTGGAGVLADDPPVSATFRRGSNRISVTLPTTDDGTDEPDASLLLWLGEGNDYALGVPAQAAMRVRDNDETPVTVTAAPESEAVTEGEDAVFVLTRTGDLSSGLDVTFEVTGGDAVLTAAPPTEAAFGAGEAMVRITLSTDDDGTDEEDAAVALTLADGDGYAPGEPSAATVSVRDNDGTPVVTVAPESEAVTEGGDAIFVLTRTGDLSSGLDVTFEVTDGDAVLTAAPPTGAAFGVGEATVRITLSTDDDGIDEEDAAVALTLADGDGYERGAPARAEVTVRDDDGLPVVTAAPESEAVTEGDDAVFVLTRRGDLSSGLDVAFEVTGGSDVLTAAPPTGASFGAGEATVRITLSTDDDGADEEDAAVTLTLADGDGYERGDPARAEVTVRDNDEDAVDAVDDEDAVVTVRAVSERIAEGQAAQFELRRSGDLSAALTAELDVSERGGDMVAASLEGQRRVTFEAGASTALLRVATEDDGVSEPDGLVTAAISQGGGSYRVGEPGSATVTVEDGGGESVLTQGRRMAAGSLLRRHVQRFSRLTSAMALERLEGGRRASKLDINGDDDEITANGDVAVDLPLRWNAWGSVRYSHLSGVADGTVWDVYAGADYLSADGRTAYGALIGYEPGRVTADGVRLEADHMQLGFYGARRLNDTLTLDAALGWGHGDGGLSVVGRERMPVTASYDSERLVVRGDLTGDFGWGGAVLRVEPQLGLLYAEETLDGFTDDMGGVALSERLWLARLGLGPKLTWSLENAVTHARVRVNLDSHNLGRTDETRERVSALLELGHRRQIDDRGSLELSAAVDGLGSSRFVSLSFGLRYELKF